MARLEDLRELRDGLKSRMAECSSDQNFAVLGRLLADVVKQIEELEPPLRRQETPVDEFTRKLLERRRAGSTVPGESASV